MTDSVKKCDGIDLGALLSLGQSYLNEEAKTNNPDPLIDYELIDQLSVIDARFTNDLCVENGEFKSYYAGTEFEDQVPKIIAESRVAATQTAGYFAHKNAASNQLASEAPITQVLVSESPRAGVKTPITRLEMVRDLMEVIAEGARVTEDVRANGSSKHLYDFLVPGTPTLDSYAFWVQTNHTRRLEVVAEYSTVLKERLTGPNAREAISKPAVADALAAANQSAWDKGLFKEYGSDMDNFFQDYSMTTDDGRIHFTPSYFDAEEEFQDDFNPDLLAKLLTTPKGDITGLSDTLLKMAQHLQDENNWFAAHYIYLQLIDNQLVVGEESSTAAKVAVAEIMGNPEEVSAIGSLLAPPIWAYGDLNAAQQYSMPEDILTFVGTFFGGGTLMSNSMKKMGELLGPRWTAYFARSPRLQRFAGRMAEQGTKRIEQARKVIENFITAGQVGRLPLNDIKFLTKSDPKFLLAKVNDGLIIQNDLVKIAEGIAAAELRLGPMVGLLAAGLGKIGALSYWTWRAATFLPRHGFSKLVVGSKLLWESATMNVAWDQGFARVIAATGNVAKDGLIILGRGVKINWKGPYIAWLGMANIEGAPLKGPDTLMAGLESLIDYDEREKAVLQQMISEVYTEAHEIKKKGREASGSSVLFKELDKAQSEIIDTLIAREKEKKRLQIREIIREDLKTKGVPEDQLETLLDDAMKKIESQGALDDPNGSYNYYRDPNANYETLAANNPRLNGKFTDSLVDLASNDLLAQIGFTLIGKENVSVVKRHKGETTISTNERMENMPTPNHKKMVADAFAKDMEMKQDALNASFERIGETFETSLTTTYGTSTADVFGDYQPSSLSSVNLGDNNPISEAAKLLPNQPIPEDAPIFTEMTYSFVKIDGRYYLVVVDQDEVNALADILG